MKTLSVTFLGKNGEKHSFSTKKISPTCPKEKIIEAVYQFFKEEKEEGNPDFQELISIKWIEHREERITKCYRSKTGFAYYAEGEKPKFKRK